MQQLKWPVISHKYGYQNFKLKIKYFLFQIIHIVKADQQKTETNTMQGAFASRLLELI